MDMSGALAATPWPVLGELVLPHLRLADEVRDNPLAQKISGRSWADQKGELEKKNM
jgi:hypothetical protein